MVEPSLPSIISKLNWRLMPVLLAMYILAFLDRTNVGFAKAAFQADTGIGDAAYAFGASIFFVGYALCEVPSNLIMHRVGARLWLSRIMVSWGLLSAATAFVHSAAAFYAMRSLLGIAEAGFFPGVILYLTYWYPRSVRARSTGVFYYGAPLALTLGSPVSGFLVAHGWGALHGWQVMFLTEGLLAAASGVGVWFLLPDGPATARWLDVDEKALLRESLGGGEQTAHGSLWRTLTDRHVAIWSAIYFVIQMGVYGLTFFLPEQVARLLGARIGLEVGLVSAIPWIAALIAIALLTRLADGTGWHKPLAAAVLAAAGLGLGLSAVAASPAIAIMGLVIAAAGLIAVQPLFWTMPTAMLQGVAAAGGIGLINAIGTLGGFVAPNVRVWLDTLFGRPAGLVTLALVCVAGALLIFAGSSGERISGRTGG